ncbi:heat shock cognate 70 kda protein 1 [Hordeum vulgare]|nr:heat shock cognate 70 kda protein 1 [Hordeum vulgare]
MDRRPSGMWLQANDCWNTPSWVMVKFSPPWFMFLDQGWKTFTGSHDLKCGQVLHFRFDGDATMLVKFFGVVGGCVECCTEGESGSDSGSSGGSDIDGSTQSIKSEDKIMTRHLAMNVVASGE